MRRSGLRIYTIHLPPLYSAGEAEPEVVREGFSVPAFLLTALWAYAHRMWVRGTVLLAVIAVLAGFVRLIGLDPAGFAILLLAFMIWVGMEAGDWYRESLDRRGWREAGVIAAESADGALRRHADLAAISSPPSGPSRPAASTSSGETAPA